MVDLDTIKKLVEKYERLTNEGKLKSYNEETTKKDFIIPLFKALGWDTESSDVSAEETIKNKRVDYGFRINGMPKFFLEAKSLREDDIITLKYVEQAIDYAWMKSCTWAILTNFRTLIVYNAEQKNPDPRMNWFLKFTDPKDYIEKSDKLLLLSRDSIERGFLDKAAEEVGKKESKKPIDKALLDDITTFREALYNNIKKNNQTKNLSEEEIEEAVQRTIDRLIFIRNAEDRGLEPEELRSKLREWSSSENRNLLSFLAKVYNSYNEDYDSKLFEPHLCDKVKIDDEVLEEVINGLYESKDKLYRYDFSLISADILGNIYEQYLGRILKKTGKTNKLEASKAKRKSEGIYYTPTYIVDYIVRNTLGELIKDKKMDIPKIKVLDPACGSGSFLIKTFDILNEYYSKKKDYSQNKLDISGTAATYTTKLRIVKDNIFGVDLDKQAVDIAQLNLLLKVAEKKKRLPILQQNIKNGNSLIDDPILAGDKAFKWNEEFAEIMGNGGFDVVIGNPPYGIVFNEKEKRYLENNLTAFRRNNDLYVAFIQKALSILKEGGLFSFIIPNTYLIGSYFNDIKNYILGNTKIIKILDFGNNHIFKDPSVFNSIIVLQKESNDKKRVENVMVFLSFPLLTEHELLNLDNYSLSIKIPQNEFINLEWRPKNEIIDKVINKMDATVSDFCEVKDVGFNYWSEGRGKKRGDSIGSRILYEDECKNPKDVPFLKGRDLLRWGYRFGNHWLRNDYKNYLQKNDTFRFSLDFLRRSPKIIYRQTADRIIATLDFNKYYLDKTVHLIVPKDGKQINLFFLLGILNSTFILYFYRETSREKGRTFAQVMTADVKKIPLKFNTIIEAKIGELVKTQLSLTERLYKIDNFKLIDTSASIKEEIAKTDNKIDELVYKLYGITEEEKKVIEKSIK